MCVCVCVSVCVCARARVCGWVGCAHNHLIHHRRNVFTKNWILYSYNDFIINFSMSRVLYVL